MDKISEIPSPDIERLKSLVQDLKKFETDRPYGENDLADKAVQVARDTLIGFKHFFFPSDIVVTYHGSMLYHDPRNLDSDIMFLSLRENVLKDPVFRLFDEIIQDKFEDLEDWPTGKEMSNLSSCSVEKIRYEAGRFRKAKRYDEFRELDMPGSASMFLTSKALFPQQEPMLEVMRAKVMGILERNPVLLEAVTHEVEDCIRIRKERRAAIHEKTS